jgi:hypothetical protein
MYRVIAKMFKFKDAKIQPVWIAKTYKNKKSAETFIAKQEKINTTYYFEIEENIRFYNQSIKERLI